MGQALSARHSTQHNLHHPEALDSGHSFPDLNRVHGGTASVLSFLDIYYELQLSWRDRVRYPMLPGLTFYRVRGFD